MKYVVKRFTISHKHLIRILFLGYAYYVNEKKVLRPAHDKCGKPRYATIK